MKKHSSNFIISLSKKISESKGLQRTALFTAGLFFVITVTANAAFEETSIGGRSAAMGGMVTALTDDANAIYQNPAGLAEISQSQFAAQYNRLYVGLDDKSNLGHSFIGIAQPLRFARDYGVLGFGWMRFELAGLYQESTFMLSYAKTGLIKNTNLGINIKYLTLSYGQDQYTDDSLNSLGIANNAPDSLFEKYGTSTGAFDIDLGAQYHIAYNYTLGLMLRNMLEPNVALDKSVDARVPRTIKLGIAHTGASYALTLDTLFKRFNKQSDWEVAAGAEKSFSGGFAIRSGLNLGSRDLLNVAFGAGYSFSTFSVDYALVYPLSGIKDTLGSHRVSLSMRFGQIIRQDSKDFAAALDAERQHRLAVEQRLITAQRELKDMRSKMKDLLSHTAVAPTPAPAAVAAPVVKPVSSFADAETSKTAGPVVAAQSVKTTAVAAESPAPSRPATAAEVRSNSIMTRTAYLRDMKQYRAGSATANLGDRLTQLKQIMDRYKDKTSISEASQEYAMLKGEFGAQEKFFRDSMTYYHKMVNRGINAEEQMDILKRVIAKYGALGLDVSSVKKELERLQKGR